MHLLAGAGAAVSFSLGACPCVLLPEQQQQHCGVQHVSLLAAGSEHPAAQVMGS